MNKSRVTVSILTMILVSVTIAVINIFLGDFENLKNTLLLLYMFISALSFMFYLIETFETLDIYDNEFHILFLIAFFGAFAFIYYEAIDKLFTFYKNKT